MPLSLGERFPKNLSENRRSCFLAICYGSQSSRQPSFAVWVVEHSSGAIVEWGRHPEALSSQEAPSFRLEKRQEQASLLDFLTFLVLAEMVVPLASMTTQMALLFLVGPSILLVIAAIEDIRPHKRSREDGNGK